MLKRRLLKGDAHDQMILRCDNAEDLRNWVLSIVRTGRILSAKARGTGASAGGYSDSGSSRDRSGSVSSSDTQPVIDLEGPGAELSWAYWDGDLSVIPEAPSVPPPPLEDE